MIRCPHCNSIKMMYDSSGIIVCLRCGWEDYAHYCPEEYYEDGYSEQELVVMML